VAPVVLGLALVLVAGTLGGHLAARLGQVAVLGELLAGVALGNGPWARSLRWVIDDPSIDILARMGALLLLFDVGLELTVSEVVATGRSAARVALLGTVASFALGWLVARVVFPEASAQAHTFVGAALTATSIGITARVFMDLGKMATPEARVVLGAAIIDDVLGLLILTLVTGAAGTNGRPGLATIVSILARAAAFFGVAYFVGSRLTPRLFVIAAQLRAPGAQTATGLVLCFAFAWVADRIGLAPIVGAFTAGLVLEESHSAEFVARGERSLREQLEPVSAFLVPVFFVLMGARVDLRVFAGGAVLGATAALTLAAVTGKLACALGAPGVRRMAVAVAMFPRGEVTLVYASIGAALPVDGKALLDHPSYSALVALVIVTTLVTPAALKWAFR
jgi:Kef-type K+ transport system membrane component KefB